MAPHAGTRAALPSTKTGLGQHFSSPHKVKDKQKTQTYVSIPGREHKHQRLLDHMEDLLNHKENFVKSTPLDDNQGLDHSPSVPHEAEGSEFHVEYNVPDDNNNIISAPAPASTGSSQPRPFNNWKTVIPTLVQPFLQYLTQTLGKPVNIPSSSISCCAQACELKQTMLGNTIQEPFRHSLGHAIQWYDILQVEVENCVQSTLEQCRQRVQEARPVQLKVQSDGHFQTILDPHACTAEPPVPNLCAMLLVQWCPTCFGGNIVGRPLLDGGDIHVATDSNFHHRHRHQRSAGDCPPFYDPAYFLPKAQVDAVGHHISKARKRQPKKHQALVPDKAIDQCETSYEAADGKKQKAAMDSFDDTGIMALICHHDIPLFFTNIDSPGEQQKYSVALIDHLFTLLPPQANVVVLYNVGCVLARSIAKYHILDDHITSRLRFATTAMHAYGHEWACQLVYNPRLAIGLGLSDGEGTERLWSRFIKLIGIERASSHQRCVWLIDRHAAAKGVSEQSAAAQKIIDECKIPIPELQSQWGKQRSAQLSIRAYAPARLKKELDSVLSLQADLDSSDHTLQATHTMIEKCSTSTETLDALDSMECSQAHLLKKIETLYALLNMQDKFPELQGVQLDFIQVLLMARDLKINIHKRAIGSFFEWDKLDWAVGGKDKALGTKLHQQTRKAIAKRQPALMAAIHKYNKYCQQLEQLYDPSYAIPLPAPLPTKLAELRCDQTLLQDVWISPSTGDIPCWLDNPSVHHGIHTVLKCDRCHEEQRQLGIEADNMCCSICMDL
ncbi:hypothetical protein PAXINDRAFT_17653 [Paxillus involutus ATCC 200175]|uniref:CxC1-like cysteine cluster associated with KDZ transposases domain-containing protein n=1 Tax=Paxillus involutus ATCC 200175 TaxID=664439 RepID=A0A0C9T0P8_PAXIN|nr:hypothetical protein PAXINDRAFT_17653 [Paxillus involutus ATCC 200175]